MNLPKQSKAVARGVSADVLTDGILPDGWCQNCKRACCDEADDCINACNANTRRNCNVTNC